MDSDFDMENSTVKLNVTFAEEETTYISEELFQVYRFRYQRQVLAAVLFAISCVGTAGNTAVIAAVPLSKKLRTVTNVFVVNLSVSDLLACAFLPWEGLAVLGEDGWPLPDSYWLCWATSVFTLCSTFCSVTNLALIAVNRYVGITKSRTTTHRIYNRRTIACMVIFSWAVPIGVVMMPPLLGVGELGYEPLYSTCSWVKKNPHSYLLNIIAGAIYLLNLVIIAVCYSLIFRYVLKTSRGMAQRDARSVSAAVTAAGSSSADYATTTRKKLWRRQVAVTKNLVYIVLAYVVCLTPYTLAVIPLGYDWSIRMTPYAAAFVFLNACVNPILYATSHPDFKEAFGHMFRCRCQMISPHHSHSITSTR